MISSVRESSSKQYPPGPRGHWLLGTLGEFRGELLQMMLDWLHRYGDAIRFRYFPGSYGYLLCHPDHYKHILQDNRQNYSKFPNPIFSMLKTFGGDGLLTSDGRVWQRQRRLLQPAFHGNNISRFSTIMTDAADQMLERWAEAASHGQRLDVAAEIIRLTLEISGRSLFSVDLARQEAQEVREAFGTVSRHIRGLSSHPLGVYFGRWLLKIPFLPGTRRFRRNVQRLNEIVEEIIARRRQQAVSGKEEPTDLLDIMMEARDKETGTAMSDQQLRDEVMTMLLTSHETVAVALTSTLYLLAEHPDEYAKLEREVDEVLGGRAPTMADIEDLSYTKMVLQESLRLYPSVYATPRTSRGPDRISGYDIDGDAIVTLSPYLTHRHPDYWPEPERFDPQRFAPDRSAIGPDQAYIPFGRGPRTCIGGHFAMTEATLIVAMVAQRYRLRPVPGHPLDLEPLITLHPRDGLPMTVHERNAARFGPDLSP